MHKATEWLQSHLLHVMTRYLVMIAPQYLNCEKFFVWTTEWIRDAKLSDTQWLVSEKFFFKDYEITLVLLSQVSVICIAVF